MPEPAAFITEPKKKRKGVFVPLMAHFGLIIIGIFFRRRIKKYVNRKLSKIPGYRGKVEGVAFSLRRGAHIVKGLRLDKIRVEEEIPFLKIEQLDLAISWSSLFKGVLTTEIHIKCPTLNYVKENMEKEVKPKPTDEDDWTKVLMDLFPLSIDLLEIEDGTIDYKEVNSKPAIDLCLEELNLVARNLANVEAEEHTLPSPVYAEAYTVGDGHLALRGRMNLMKEVPDMDFSLALTDMDARALNDFARHYAKIDFVKGEVGVFSEIAVADGYMKGYLKVLLKGTTLVGKDDPFFNKLWEGFVGFFQFILKNQKTDTLAVKAPLKGDLNNIKTGVWAAIGSIFKNAFAKAFKLGVDEEIEFEDAIQEDVVIDIEKPAWWKTRQATLAAAREAIEDAEDEAVEQHAKALIADGRQD